MNDEAMKTGQGMDMESCGCDCDACMSGHHDQCVTGMCKFKMKKDSEAEPEEPTEESSEEQ